MAGTRNTCYHRRNILKKYQDFTTLISDKSVLINNLPKKYANDVLKFFKYVVTYEKKHNKTSHKDKCFVYGVSYEVMVPIDLPFKKLSTWAKNVATVLEIDEYPYICLYEKKGSRGTKNGFYVHFIASTRKYLENGEETFEKTTYYNPKLHKFTTKNDSDAVAKKRDIVLKQEFSSKKLDVYVKGVRKLKEKNQRISDQIQKLSKKDFGVAYDEGYITKKVRYEIDEAPTSKNNKRVLNKTLAKADKVFKELENATLFGMGYGYGKEFENFEENISSFLSSLNAIKSTEKFSYYQHGSKKKHLIVLDFLENSRLFYKKVKLLAKKIENIKNYLLDIGWNHQYETIFSKNARHAIYAC